MPPSSTALLVVDVQQALCTGAARAVAIDAVVDRINALAARARAANAAVILVQHEEPDSPLQFASPGWALYERLDVQDGDIRLRKRASDAFHATDLQAILQARGMRRLVVCGMHSEFCVDSTVRRALALGYPVALAADAHTTVDNAVLSAAQVVAHHNVTLAGIGSYGVRAVPVPAAAVSFAD